MTDDPEQRELERAFAALRAEDRRSAPDFERLLARQPAGAGSRRSARRLRLAAAAATVLVLAVGAALWWTRPAGDEMPVDTGPLIAWRAPTDVLLDTPGRSLLADLPVFGGVELMEAPAESRPKGPAAEPPRGRKETTR